MPGFIVQGGDPTGTGSGGESVYGAPFKVYIYILHINLFVTLYLLFFLPSSEKSYMKRMHMQ